MPTFGCSAANAPPRTHMSSRSVKRDTSDRSSPPGSHTTRPCTPASRQTPTSPHPRSSAPGGDWPSSPRHSGLPVQSGGALEPTGDSACGGSPCAGWQCARPTTPTAGELSDDCGCRSAFRIHWQIWPLLRLDEFPVHHNRHNKFAMAIQDNLRSCMLYPGIPVNLSASNNRSGCNS